MRIEVENVIFNLITSENRLEITVETKDGQIVRFHRARMEQNTGKYSADIEYVANAVKKQYSVVRGDQHYSLPVLVPREGNESCLLEVFET